ncbi:MAG: PAS domain S-box protein [Acidimicrobiia bacterium]|nr:PAS domain S-box protein [Acidimicrobiia bacterium]
MNSQNSLDVLGSFVANLPVAVFRTTPDDRFVAGNEALGRILGAENLDDLTDVAVSSLYVEPAIRHRMQERAAAGASVAADEIQLRRLDGTQIWVRITSRGVFDADGNIECYEGVLEDITDSHDAGQELAESNAMLDALSRIQNRFIAGGDAGELFDALLADLLAISESDYGFIAGVRYDTAGSPFLRTFAMTNISWNEATRRMFAELGPRGMEFHNLDTLFGRPVTERIPILSNDPNNDPRRAGRPEGHPPLDSFLGIPLLKGETVLGVIALANRLNGYDQSLVERLQPLVAAVGSVVESVRIDESRLAAETRVRSQQDLYAAVVEYAAEGVVVFGEDGVTIAFNPASERITGYLESEIVGEPIASLLGDELFGPESLAPASRARGASSEGMIIRRSGRRVPVEMSLSRTAAGGRTVFTAILRDIAERKETEAALRNAKETAERTSRAKDEFLAGMSHELRTPLNAVIGLSSLLTRQVHGTVNDKQRQYLDQIEDSGRHLLELINDILDLAKIEADKLEALVAPVEVLPLVESALGVIRETATGAGLRTDVDVDRDLPRVLADARRTKQVLINLLSNATKFTESGGTIGVTAREAEGMVAVTIWDTGVGIPEDQLSNIFSPFEQVDHSLARSHEGTGLGLTLSRRFVEMQNGTLTVESVPGSGSQFTFTLPVVPDVSEPILSPTTESAGTQPTAAAMTRVLVVEDNAVNRLIVTDYLEACGYHTDVAVDGEEAVEKALALLPDVILMDVQLPRRDGLSATRELKSRSETAAIPVIALTALAMSGDAERCYEAGCDGYLSKPCDPDDFVAAIEKFLHKDAGIRD